jgi:hypothetical protein
VLLAEGELSLPLIEKAIADGAAAH